MLSKYRSNNALLHFFIIFVFAAIVLVVNLDFIIDLYFGDRITSFGLALNGAIVAIFLAGTVKLVSGFLHYAFEEKQIDIFIDGKEKNDDYLFQRMSTKSIISRRYFRIKHLYERGVPINHGALSTITYTEESRHMTFPEFVNNILILTGVFGTVVSVITALTGASTVLKESVLGDGMWLIIYGMNTALTTTATAIVCYFFFSYFYQRLKEIRSYIFGKLDETSMMYIIPNFTFEAESVNLKTEKLIKELSLIVGELKKVASGIEPAFSNLNAMNASQSDKLDKVITHQDSHLKKLDLFIEKTDKIKNILAEGFRLSK